MALKIHKASPYKTRLLSTLIMVFALLVQPLVALNIPSAFAADTLSVTPDNFVIHGNNPNITEVSSVNGIGHQNMKLSFDYNAELLDNNEYLHYGWRTIGGTNNLLGSIEGKQESGVNKAIDETGSVVNVSIPATGNDTEFELYFTNTGKTATNNGEGDAVTITNITVSGDAISVVEPELIAQDFATWNNSPSFRGFSVGFAVSNFGEVASAVIDVERADGSVVSKEARTDMLAFLSNKTTLTQGSAPFVIEPGTVTGQEDTSTWWGPQTNLPWTSETKPVKATITVVGENGMRSVVSEPFIEGDIPEHPAYEDMILPVVPTHPDPTNSNQLTLSGYVFHNLNSDRDKDEGEDILGEWTVRVYREDEESGNTWQLVGVTNTKSADNKYSIRQYEAGIYHVCLVNKVGWTQIRQDWSGTPYHTITENQSGATDEGAWCSTVDYDDTADRSNAKYFGVLDTKKPFTEVVSPETDGGIYNTPFSVQIRTTDNESGIVQAVANLYGSGGLLGSCVNQQVSPAVVQYEYTCGIDINDLSDGNYFLKINSKDVAGNTSNTITWNFTIDKTAPVVIITNPAHNSVHNSNVALRATVTDENPHHYWLQIKKNGSVVNIPGVTGTINTTESFTNKLLTTLTESGNYEVTIAARDAAGSGSDTGNRSSDVVVKFVIDKSIPTIDISNVAISTDKKLSFDLVANDTVSGLKVVAANIYDAANVNKLIELGSGNPTRLNEPHEGLPFGTLTFSKSLSGIDVSGLASGTYTIRAYALDHAGNKLEYKTVQFAVDNTPPEKVTGLSAHNADGEITDGVARLFNVTIKWNAVADAEKYEYCYWNDIAGNIYNEENCYTVFPTGNQQSGEFNQGEGLHHIKVRAIDAAGNKGPWSDTFDIFYLENDAVVNGENFNTHSGDDYKGFNIGFNIDYFSEVTGVTVELFDGDTPMVANAHNQKLLDLININGTKQLSTPFITIAGSYVEEYWDLGLYDWASDSPRPTKAVVTVTGKNNIGQDVTRIAILEDLSEPNDWTFESILPEDESKIDEGSKTPAKENSNSLNGRNENSNPQGGENQNQDSTPFFANFAPFANIFQQPLTPPADSTPAETDGNDSTNTGGSGILGDQDEDGTPLTDTGDVKGAMDSKFMGLSLYWWLALIVGFIISLWLIFAALMRRRSQNEA